MRYKNEWLTVFSLALITGCGSSGENQDKGQTDNVEKPAEIVVSTTKLEADGPDTGLNAYQLIIDKFGPGSIESPDLYESDHQTDTHIIEQTDDIVGPHFVFKMHKEQDGNKGEYIDRQRNEIKIFDRSDNALKGFEGETFEYAWLFKVDSQLELSKNFSHFFQLKAVGGDSSHPILTLTGVEKSGKNTLQIRYSPYVSDQILVAKDWLEFTDKWLSVTCRVTYGEFGQLTFEIKDYLDDSVLLSVNRTNLDLWRGTKNSDFVRPKWGIYRSLSNSESLREDEETVRFANFSITELVIE
ncbi:hypothetical protein [Catenovulum adriaticum]|uniref:Polysaccharide lyase-like protein n=1 Tax=Catenovulum adriaticum TaxID=2984846 RepID=A0ABY7ASF8_9ALTE|nr:hypothetical protein [Catenovulum sp. TS8]WAJ72255.1 hypothetical protein OLW01_16060 [Catenovulum sp. TS8]